MTVLWSLTLFAICFPACTFRKYARLYCHFCPLVHVNKCTTFLPCQPSLLSNYYFTETEENRIVVTLLHLLPILRHLLYTLNVSEYWDTSMTYNWQNIMMNSIVLNWSAAMRTVEKRAFLNFVILLQLLLYVGGWGSFKSASSTLYVITTQSIAWCNEY